MTRRPLPGSERVLRAGSRLVGPVDPKETIDLSVLVRARERINDAAAFAGSRLDRGEFVARYGASAEHLAQVERFAADSSLTVIGRDEARRSVVLSGTARDVSAAFRVQLNYYDAPIGPYRGREGPIYCPSRLSAVLRGLPDWLTAARLGH